MSFSDIVTDIQSNTLPHRINTHHKKNPFNRSVHLPKSTEVTGTEKYFTVKVPRTSCPDFIRIPTHGTSDEIIGKTFALKKFEMDISLSKEIDLNFQMITLMPLVTAEDIESRTILLNEQPKGTSGKTLILDIDETLIHVLTPKLAYTNIKQENLRGVKYAAEGIIRSMFFIIRPYAIQLLEKLYKLYEIIVFTESEQYYADSILEVLDPKRKYISYRMYRDKCIIKGKHTLKDLRIFKSRSLHNMVIVDNKITCFAKHLSNGIHVPSYRGKKGDTALRDVIELLKQIANSSSIPEELDSRIGLKQLYTQFILNLNSR